MGSERFYIVTLYFMPCPVSRYPGCGSTSRAGEMAKTPVDLPPDPGFSEMALRAIAGFALGLSGLRSGSRPAIGRGKVGIIERKIECIEGLGISPAGEHQSEN
jgi:hypothetical protein